MSGLALSVRFRNAKFFAGDDRGRRTAERLQLPEAEGLLSD
jgi:hypothetical protein